MSLVGSFGSLAKRGLHAGQPAIDLSFLTSTFNTSDLSTYTFSSQTLGVAREDRQIIVAVIGIATGSRTFSMTVGGISATDITTVANHNDAQSYITIGLYRADVPTGTTGDVVVTWSSTMVRCSIGLWRIAGAGLRAPYHSATDIVASSNVLSADVNAQNGGGVIAAAVNAGSGVMTLRTVTWAGVTENYDAEMESARSMHGGSSATTVTEAKTVTATFSSTVGNLPAMVVASFR